MRAAALILLALFAFSPLTPSFAQERAESAAARHGVPAERVVSPGGIEAWLVSDSTVPMMVLQAYWRGGSAIEPETHIGVTSALADMLTEGAGELDAQAFKQRLAVTEFFGPVARPAPRRGFEHEAGAVLARGVEVGRDVAPQRVFPAGPGVHVDRGEVRNIDAFKKDQRRFESAVREKESAIELRRMRAVFGHRLALPSGACLRRC